MVAHEVEQKFRILTQLLPRFRSNGGSPPFRHLRFLRTEHFEDAYYDSCDKLSSNGLWVRRRDAEWEAKHRKSGDFTRTTFHETTDLSEIQSLVSSYTKLDARPDADFGLDLISRFRTTREVYRADEKFLVMLDTTDFGHLVGEVELQAHDEKRAHVDIDTFMQKYAWFFSQGNKPKGKLTAYFEKFGYPRS